MCFCDHAAYHRHPIFSTLNPQLLELNFELCLNLDPLDSMNYIQNYTLITDNYIIWELISISL